MIYKIVNKVNNKVYVGKTIQKFSHRKTSHISSLNTKKHNNKHLLSAWVKYGADNFIFEEIEKCDKYIINEREKYWINFYNSFDEKHGYNKTLGGDGGSGTKRTQEEIDNLIIRNKNRIWTDEMRKKNSERVKLFQSTYWDNNKKEKARKRMIGNSFRKGVKGTDEFKESCKKRLTGTTHTEETKQKCFELKKAGAISIKCIETGVIFRSISNAGDFFKTSNSNIKSQLVGKLKRVKGYTFQYI
jgi:group I intron endonuclease